jgi:hypothetical protein
MGSSCGCERSLPNLKPVEIIRTPTSSRTAFPPNSSCRCLNSGRICPLPNTASHWCRCILMSSRGQAACRSNDHQCLCKTGGPNVTCRRHLISFPTAPGICCICLATYENPKQLIVKLKVCNHYYHLECLKRWLMQGQHYCPMCMRGITH